MSDANPWERFKFKSDGLHGMFKIQSDHAGKEFTITSSADPEDKYDRPFHMSIEGGEAVLYSTLVQNSEGAPCAPSTTMYFAVVQNSTKTCADDVGKLMLSSQKREKYVFVCNDYSMFEQVPGYESLTGNGYLNVQTGEETKTPPEGITYYLKNDDKWQDDGCVSNLVKDDNVYSNLTSACDAAD